MLSGNILILDAEIESAIILMEYLNALGYSRVYLSTNQNIIKDLFQNQYFKLLFIAHNVLENWDGKHILTHLPVEPRADIILLNNNFTPEVAGTMELLHTRRFLKKPFTLEEVRNLIAKSDK